MPEVIRDEIVKHAVKAGEEAVESVHTGFALLEKLVGSRPNLPLVTRHEIERVIESRFLELQSLLLDVPFTPEHAKSALSRVNSELPPNGPKNQHFKDSAIWEALLGLAKTHKVHFVTSDKGFFQNREPSKGLAANLLSEVDDKSLDIRVYHEKIEDCLNVLKSETPSLDKKALGNAIDKEIKARVIETVSKQSFRVNALLETKIDAFVTEKHLRLTLAFELAYSVSDATDSDVPRTNGKVTVRGECSFDLDSNQLTDIIISSEELAWFDQEQGQQRKAGIHHITGMARIVLGGVGTSPYTFRKPL
jgi:hypothetical protein